jgi:ATP-dependent DNA helicase PIF1
MKLIQSLKDYRLSQSIELGVPPYAIYSNAVLNDIGSMRPSTEKEIKRIKGFGKKRFEKYGKDILRICADTTLTYDESDTIPIAPKLSEDTSSREFTTIPFEALRHVPYSPTGITLSEEQKKAIDMCDKGHNVFISGPGGVGKSLLIDIFQRRYSPLKRVQICALTGVAAEILGCSAKTIHSWSGVSTGKQDAATILGYVKKSKPCLTRWKTTDILIIDEVSMMSKKLFETLDYVGKHLRHNEKPFGGCQLLFLGDFYQLPPVGDNQDPDTSSFCFESPLWSPTFQHVILLHTIFRQSDKVFMKLLHQVRQGGISKNSFERLCGRTLRQGHKLVIDKTMKPTIISPLKHTARTINEKNMAELTGESYSYQSTLVKSDEFNHKTFSLLVDREIIQLEKRMNADKQITLMVGARVMCVVNLDMGGGPQIVNGSQGIITKFVDGLPVVAFKNGITKLMDYHQWRSDDLPGLSVKQIPLILSWAITIHKSQGVTLDSALIDAGSNIFEYGQTYVALSRVKTLEGVYLSNFDANKIRTNPKVTKYYAHLK